MVHVVTHGQLLLTVDHVAVDAVVDAVAGWLGVKSTEKSGAEGCQGAEGSLEELLNSTGHLKHACNLGFWNKLLNQ